MPTIEEMRDKTFYKHLCDAYIKEGELLTGSEWRSLKILAGII